MKTLHDMKRMRKIVLPGLLMLLAAQAHAQQAPQTLLTGLRPVCARLIDKDMARDMNRYSSQPLDPEKVCDCASARIARDPVFKRVAGLNREQRQSMPKGRETSMYLSAKFFSASHACYADAIRASADGIGIGK